MSNRLGGKQGTAYLGTNANQPPNWHFNDRDPDQFDTQNVSIGDFWLNSNGTGIGKMWVLVSLEGNSTSKGMLAEWVQLSAGDLESLTGNVGGPVFPDALNGNINVIGDGTTMNIVGNPATNTLTASVAQEFAATYTTDDANFAVPVAYNLNIFGAGGITTSSAGNTVTITGSGGTLTGLEGDNLNVATPTAGVIAIAGGLNITTAATAGPNTVSVSVSGTTNHEVQIGNATGSLTSVPNGTTGQLLTAQTGADPVWQSRGASQCAFSVFLNGTAANVTGDGTVYTVAFDTELFDIGNNFDTGTATFTAPVTGLYLFTVTFTLGNMGATGTQSAIGTYLLTPPRNYVQSNVLAFADDTAQHQETDTYIVQLSASDTVQFAVESVFIVPAGKTQSIIGGSALDARTLWSGVLLI